MIEAYFLEIDIFNQFRTLTFFSDIFNFSYLENSAVKRYFIYIYFSHKVK